MPYDKSAPQPPEHVQALKRFRRKIRHVRDNFNSLRDRDEDTLSLMSKEFVIVLAKTPSDGGAGDEAAATSPKKEGGGS